MNLPIAPDWRDITNTLYVHYYSYKRFQDAMAKQGVIIDYSTLAALRDGTTLQPRWSTGAALMNLYAEVGA